MLASSSGPDAASRAAFRVLMKRLPGISPVESGASPEPFISTDPPLLRSVQNVEGSSFRVVKVPDFTRSSVSGFGAFLDGTQQMRFVGHHLGVPIVFGTVAAGVRVRVNRRLITWGHEAPRVQRRIYLPLRYLPLLSEIRDESSEIGAANWEIVDTSTADKNGDYPSQHPTVLQERARRAVDEDRDRLEDFLAEAWCVRAEAPLFIDGGISRSERVASRSRNSVMSWYLRVRDEKGHEPMWGLLRIEIAETDRPTDRADEISRWVMAETTPLSLPDGRWDKMAYGVRDCEEFLRAIS